MNLVLVYVCVVAAAVFQSVREDGPLRVRKFTCIKPSQQDNHVVPEAATVIAVGETCLWLIICGCDVTVTRATGILEEGKQTPIVDVA